MSTAAGQEKVSGFWESRTAWIWLKRTLLLEPLPGGKALTGIISVLETGIPWEDLPQKMGCGCGMSCWRCLQEWHEAGV
jgi:transposase